MKIKQGLISLGSTLKTIRSFEHGGLFEVLPVLTRQPVRAAASMYMFMYASFVGTLLRLVRMGNQKEDHYSLFSQSGERHEKTCRFSSGGSRQRSWQQFRQCMSLARRTGRKAHVCARAYFCGRYLVVRQFKGQVFLSQHTPTSVSSGFCPRRDNGLPIPYVVATWIPRYFTLVAWVRKPLRSTLTTCGL